MNNKLALTGTELRRIRQSLGMSQGRLTQHLGYSENWIALVETEKKRSGPRFRDANVFAQGAGLNPGRNPIDLE